VLLKSNALQLVVLKETTNAVLKQDSAPNVLMETKIAIPSTIARPDAKHIKNAMLLPKNVFPVKQKTRQVARKQLTAMTLTAREIRLASMINTSS